MSSSRIQTLNTLFCFASLSALGTLVSGCAVFAKKETVEYVAKPTPVSLTPAHARLTDEALHADLGVLDRLAKKAEELPATSPARAEAEGWLEAAHTEYLLGSWRPFVDEAAAHATSLVSNSSPSLIGSDKDIAAASLRSLDAWIAHVRTTRGFRAALPLLKRAENLRGFAEQTPAAAHPNDFLPRDWPSDLLAAERQLASLYDQGKVPLNSYAWAKAQAWLDFAADENFARDRSAIVQRTRANAAELIHVLESAAQENRDALAHACDATLAREAHAAENFYPSLCAAAKSAHSSEFPHQLTEYNPRLASLAELEVSLVHAAYERVESGRRASSPYEQAARRIAATLSSVQP